MSACQGCSDPYCGDCAAKDRRLHLPVYTSHRNLTEQLIKRLRQLKLEIKQVKEDDTAFERIRFLNKKLAKVPGQRARSLQDVNGNYWEYQYNDGISPNSCLWDPKSEDPGNVELGEQITQAYGDYNNSSKLCTNKMKELTILLDELVESL